MGAAAIGALDAVSTQSGALDRGCVEAHAATLDKTDADKPMAILYREKSE